MLTLTILLLPFAGAKLTSGTNTAPYSGTHTTLTRLEVVSTCAHAKSQPGTFNESPGNSTDRATSKSKQCSLNPSVYGVADAFTQVAFPTHLNSTKQYSVSIDIGVSLSASEAFTVGGSCPFATPLKSGAYTSSSCYVVAAVFVEFQTWMYDGTNGTVYGTGRNILVSNNSSLTSFSSCFAGKCSGYNISSHGTGGGFNGATSFLIGFTPYYPLVKTHHYWVVVYTIASAYTATTSSNSNGHSGFVGGATSSASVNMASVGHGWTVNWISIY